MSGRPLVSAGCTWCCGASSWHETALVQTPVFYHILATQGKRYIFSEPPPQIPREAFSASWGLSSIRGLTLSHCVMSLATQAIQRVFQDHGWNRTLGRTPAPRKHAPTSTENPSVPTPLRNEVNAGDSGVRKHHFFGQNVQFLCQDHVQRSGTRGSDRMDLKTHVPGAGKWRHGVFTGCMDNTTAHPAHTLC